MNHRQSINENAHLVMQHRHYTTEEVQNAVDNGGKELQVILDMLMRKVMNHHSLERQISKYILDRGGTEEDVKDIFNEGIGKFIEKLSFGEIRLIPGELFPYFAAKECLKYLDVLDASGLKDSVLQRDETGILETAKSKRKKSRLSGEFRCHIELGVNSQEIVRQFQTQFGLEDQLIDTILEKLRGSDDFMAKLDTYVFRLRREFAEETEKEAYNKLKEEVVTTGLANLRKSLSMPAKSKSKPNSNYNFEFLTITLAYIFGTCKNRWLSTLRDRIRAGAVTGVSIDEEDYDIMDSDPTVDELLESDEQLECILKALEKQPNKCNKVLKLLALRYSITEIAEELGMTYDAAKVKIFRCRKKFRTYLRAYCYNR